MQMKTLKYLFLPVIFLITSCYIYKPHSGKEEIVAPIRSENPAIKSKSLRSDDGVDPARSQRKEKEDQIVKKELSPEEETILKQKETEKKKESEMKNEEREKSTFTSADGTQKNTKVTDKEKPEEETKESGEMSLRDKLKPNRFYKITVSEKQYKIQVDKWEGDTLVSHKIRRPEKQYKFHLNDIDEESVLERRFSKPFSDLLTVGAYAAGGAAVLLLIL